MLNLHYKNVNNKIYEEYLKYLLEKYFDININSNIIINNPFLNYSCFYPLPSSLEINNYSNNDKVIKNNNFYQFIGNSSHYRIFFGNRLLPNINSDPIPFTFPIKTINNTIELLNTNYFYFEITMDERTRESWNNEKIFIGFGSILLPIYNNSYFHDSICYNLTDGIIQLNETIIKTKGPICNIGDTIGAGIIYISTNTYKFFFTFNGSLITNEQLDNNVIIIKSQITTIIGYNHSCKIKVNFGDDIFKFDIKYYSDPSNVLSQNNKFINNHEFIDNINTKEIICNKIKNKHIGVPFFILSENTIPPMFSFLANNNSVNFNLFNPEQNNVDNSPDQNNIFNIIGQNNFFIPEQNNL